MSAILLCIVTGRGKAAGSCVRIDDIELDGVRYQGPGKVTKALGITVPKSVGVAEITDDWLVEIHIGEQSPVQPRRRPAKTSSPKSQPLLDRNGLRRLMPKIVNNYVAEESSITFEEYLHDLLRDCETEADLRKRVG